MSHKKTTIVRALGICSGGLDSILSALVLREQGIEVAWVNFETPFFSSRKARKAAKITGVHLTVKDITSVYINMLKDPQCGYGGNMNPCLDCHALMFRLAADMMRKEGFHFLFSGEVLGQRPMSQTKPSLRYVEKNSGIPGYIVRPLSAKCLPVTIPEQNGLVDRNRLLDITGRGRKRQIAMAAAYGITEYPAPAGGCLLADKGFSRRLKDLFDHHDDHDKRDFDLLRYGRHFRMNQGNKIIVGRTKHDNDRMASLVKTHLDVTVRMADMPSPLAMIPYGAPEKAITEAAQLCAAYSKTKEGAPAKLSVRGPLGYTELTVTTPSKARFQSFMV